MPDGYTGLPLVVGTFRGLGGHTAVEAHLKLKRRERGVSEADMIEGFLLVLSAGGECSDDFAVLGADQGLAATLGRSLAKPDLARKFVYRLRRSFTGRFRAESASVRAADRTCRRRPSATPNTEISWRIQPVRIPVSGY